MSDIQLNATIKAYGLQRSQSAKAD